MSEQLSKPEKHLENKISDWLKKHGYPLEMTVAHALQNAGYYVIPSASYKDPDTDIVREIDLTAQRHCGIDKPVFFQVACTIECKLSPDKPWILFMPHSHEDRFVPFDTLASIIIVGFLHEIYETLISRMSARKSKILNYFSQNMWLTVLSELLPTKKILISHIMRHYPH